MSKQKRKTVSLETEHIIDTGKEIFNLMPFRLIDCVTFRLTFYSNDL